MAEMRAPSTDIALRPGDLSDAAACGVVCYEAFSDIAGRHGFPPDFPSAEIATGLMSMLLSHPGFYSVVAELDGEIVGSNFLDERSPVIGLGPITVSPGIQNRRVGRLLMEAALDRVRDREAPGVRLLQAVYHGRSLALYARLGFQLRETLATMQGPPIGMTLPGHHVRPAREADLEACNRLCTFVHGHHRSGEVKDAIDQGTAMVVEHMERITGYATDLAFFAHAVAETDRDLMALIGAARAFGGPGILVPLRNAAMFRWCLDHGLKVVQVMTLMTMGLYSEPRGAYLPSVLY